VILSWKGSKKELEEATARLETVQNEKNEGDIVAALEKAKSENKHTKAREDEVRTMLKDKDVTHKGANAMIGAWGVVSMLAAGADPKKPAGGGSEGGPAVLTHNGKSYADMKPAQRVALKRSNPDLYNQMREADQSAN